MKGCSLEKTNDFSGDMKSNLEIFKNEKHELTMVRIAWY